MQGLTQIQSWRGLIASGLMLVLGSGVLAGNAIASSAPSSDKQANAVQILKNWLQKLISSIPGTSC